ncbi:MAG TPA: glycosyltransferase, partial [Anaerolineae bacterium]|nr:glycosyltransferase [Anaerolineae bacterium]
LCAALQPDAILSIQRYANIAILQSRLLTRRRVPVIVNEQNRIGFEFQQFGGGRFKRAMLKWLYPHANAITVISHGIAQELAQDYSIDPRRVHVIYNPIDLAALQDRSHSAPPHPWLAENDPPTLIAAGRLVPQKGFDLLLHALTRIKAERFVRLIVLGEGPDRSMLEKLRDDLGLRAVVEFPGFQSNIAAFYSRAATFVLASRYEGFGNVLVEAMACGTPVVSFRCPSGPDEIIEHEQSGLLVPPEDVAALSAAIMRVLGDRALADLLRRGGLARAKTFDAPIIAAQYADLIEALCAS